jgi:hypothetical protein
MWTRRKIAVIAVSVALLLVGITGGAVLAQNNDSNTQTPPQGEDLLAKVVTIYQQKTGVAIDEAQLQASFQQAEQEIQQAREQTMIQNLVTQGKLTQDQADQYLNWLKSKPEMPGFGRGFGFGGGFQGRGGSGPCFQPPQNSGSTTQ